MANDNDYILRENDECIIYSDHCKKYLKKFVINTNNQIDTPVKFIHNEKIIKSKTKKHKTELNVKEKQKLWDMFDKNILDDKNKVECVYSKQELDLCNLCNNILIITEDGLPTCNNKSCGVIYRETLDYSPEWRFHSSEDKTTNDPTRCGNPINPLLMESSYGCKVLCNNNSTYEMKKIRKWTEWQSMPHKEKSLYDEFQFITNMAHNGGIPKKFIDDAMVIHKDISEQKMFRGMNRDGIKSASIYLACRLNDCPRTPYEIAEIFKLDKTSATNGCSMAVNILNNIERNSSVVDQSELGITLPSSFIERFSSRLNFNKELTMLSKFIAKKIEETNLITDNIPHAIAAGILYFITINCNLNNSKAEIRQISGVSEVTINKCYKKLDLNKNILLPKIIMEKYCYC
jgi:transcription initiation factor TFIIB